MQIKNIRTKNLKNSDHAESFRRKSKNSEYNGNFKRNLKNSEYNNFLDSLTEIYEPMDWRQKLIYAISEGNVSKCKHYLESGVKVDDYVWENTKFDKTYSSTKLTNTIKISINVATIFKLLVDYSSYIPNKQIEKFCKFSDCMYIQYILDKKKADVSPANLMYYTFPDKSGVSIKNSELLNRFLGNAFGYGNIGDNYNRANNNSVVFDFLFEKYHKNTNNIEELLTLCIFNSNAHGFDVILDKINVYDYWHTFTNIILDCGCIEYFTVKMAERLLLGLHLFTLFGRAPHIRAEDVNIATLPLWYKYSLMFSFCVEGDIIGDIDFMIKSWSKELLKEENAKLIQELEGQCCCGLEFL